MQTRNAASVLPEPVGAAISVWRPAAISRQPSACGSVGPSGNRPSNQRRTAGWNDSSTRPTLPGGSDIPPVDEDVPGASSGSGGWAVAVEDLGFVFVPGGGGAVGVEHDGPAPAVDDDLVVERAEQGAVLYRGVAAVGFAGQVVDFAS